MEKMESEFAKALPKHISPDHFIRVSMTACNTTPALLDCTKPSLFGAVMQSAQLGLMPDGVMGNGYLIPYNKSIKQPDGTWKKIKQAQFIPGYKGLIQLAYRTGQVRELYAKCVYQGDDFDLQEGLNRNLYHVPKDKFKNPEKLLGAYAVIKYINGGYDFVYMTATEIEYLRSTGNGKSNSVWDDHKSAMYEKTAIRKLLKTAYLSNEDMDFQKAVSITVSNEEANKPTPQILTPEQAKKIGLDENVVEAEYKEYNDVVEAGRKESSENAKKVKTSNNASQTIKDAERK